MSELFNYVISNSFGAFECDRKPLCGIFLCKNTTLDMDTNHHMNNSLLILMDACWFTFETIS